MSTSRMRSTLANAITRGIADTQPGLRVTASPAGVAVSGLFNITQDETPIDSFQVRIELTKHHPSQPPKVFETGGRLPRDLDHHFFSDGRACLFYPPVYWLQGYNARPFEEFLEGPVRNFFLYQCARIYGVDWPHDEMSHGHAAVLEFFADLLGSDTSPEETLRLLSFAERNTLLSSLPCPCGERRRGVVSNCHPGMLRFVQAVPPRLVTSSASAVRDALRNNIKGGGCSGAGFSLLHTPTNRTTAAITSRE